MRSLGSFSLQRNEKRALAVSASEETGSKFRGLDSSSAVERRECVILHTA